MSCTRLSHLPLDFYHVLSKQRKKESANSASCRVGAMANTTSPASQQIPGPGQLTDDEIVSIYDWTFLSNLPCPNKLFLCIIHLTRLRARVFSGQPAAHATALKVRIHNLFDKICALDLDIWVREGTPRCCTASSHYLGAPSPPGPATTTAPPTMTRRCTRGCGPHSSGRCWASCGGWRPGSSAGAASPGRWSWPAWPRPTATCRACGCLSRRASWPWPTSRPRAASRCRACSACARCGGRAGRAGTMRFRDRASRCSDRLGANRARACT